MNDDDYTNELCKFPNFSLISGLSALHYSYGILAINLR